MDTTIRATITRSSNGSVDLQPVAGEPNPFNIERITLQTTGTPSAKDFPVDTEATVSISSGVRSTEALSPEAPTVSDEASVVGADAAALTTSERRKAK